MNGRLQPVAVGIVATAAVALPWLTDAYIVTVASTALIAAIVAVSAHLLHTAGLDSLGQAAYAGIGAYTAAWIAQHHTTSAPLLLLAATTTAAVAAAVTGLAVSRTRGIAFLLATFGLAELARTAADHATPLTGGSNGLGTPPVTSWPGREPITHDGYAYLNTLAVFAVLVTLAVLLLRSRPGLVWRAIAANEARTAATGYPVAIHLWTLYTLAGAVAGAAGMLLVTVHRFVAPADLGFDASAIALVAAIIGGRHLSVTIAVAVGLVAVRDLTGLTGSAPLLLGLAMVAAALSTRLRRTEAPA